MDRSRLPYDTGPDFNKVTSGLDELSLKKQLPLRQQATKPVLKYNTSMAKSVHLFSHGDGMIGRRDSAGINLYTQNGMYYTGHISGNHQGYTHEMSSASRHPSAQNSNTVQTVNGRNTPSNPYVRPVSATEVAANINSEKARRMVEAAAAISNISEKTTTAFQAQTLQRNSFLRPLSGTGSSRDKQSSIVLHSTSNSSTSQRPPDSSASFIKREDSYGSEITSKHIAESKHTKKTLFDFASTTSTTLVKPHINQNVQGGLQHPGTISQGSKSPSQNYAMSFVRNPSYSPNKPYANGTIDATSHVKKEPSYGSMGSTQPSIINGLPDKKYHSDSGKCCSYYFQYHHHSHHHQSNHIRVSAFF